MSRSASHATRAVLAFAAAIALAACSSDNATGTTPITGNNFSVTRLVANTGGQTALNTDAQLQNAWGITFGPTGTLWVSDNHTGMSTQYDPVSGMRESGFSILNGGATGAPTGVVYNGTGDFNIGLTGPATFIYAGEDGTISAWNPTLGSAAVVVADNSANGAVYKGITMGVGPTGENLLFASDFHNNSVDVYDASFNLVNRFTDPTLPTGYAPFGVTSLGGHVWVTYALQKGPDKMDDQPGLGNGYVDVFGTDGGLATRFTSGGKLNSPWAVALAPANFGPFGGDILIGNFGDGKIGVYNRLGHFVANLHDATGADISLDGLWGLTFGGSNATTLYFASGPNDENNGLVGSITPQ